MREILRDGRSRRLQQAVLAGAIIFVLVFALGTVLGVVRNLWVAPRIGALAAIACEVPLMIASAWMVSSFAIRWLSVPADRDARLVVGGVAFVTLQAAEMLLAYLVLGLDPAAYWQMNATLAGALGIAAQLFVFWSPILQGQIERENRSSSLRGPECGAVKLKSNWSNR